MRFLNERCRDTRDTVFLWGPGGCLSVTVIERERLNRTRRLRAAFFSGTSICIPFYR